MDRSRFALLRLATRSRWTAFGGGLLTLGLCSASGRSMPRARSRQAVAASRPRRGRAVGPFWPDPCTVGPALHDRKEQPAPTGDKVRCNCDRVLAVAVENVWVLAAYKRIPTEELMQPPLALLLFSAVAATAEARNWFNRSRCINSRPPNGIPVSSPATTGRTRRFNAAFGAIANRRLLAESASSA